MGTQEVVKELWGLVLVGGKWEGWYDTGFLLFPAAWMGSHLQTGEWRAGQRPEPRLGVQGP